MKSIIEKEDIEIIAATIIEKLLPILSISSKSEEDELLTIDEAAKFLKTSKAQVYQWVNNSQHGLGDFPYYKAGKLLRFSKRALIKWLESR